MGGEGSLNCPALFLTCTFLFFFLALSLVISLSFLHSVYVNVAHQAIEYSQNVETSIIVQKQKQKHNMAIVYIFIKWTHILTKNV